MRRIWRRDHTLQSFVGALPSHLELTAGQPGPVPAMSDAPYIPRISSIYILCMILVVVIPCSQVKSEVSHPRGCTIIHLSSAHVSLGCLPTRRGLIVDHGALPYRAAHKAVNPSRADPMLILIVSIQVPEYMLALLQAKPAYQVSPVYDHFCHSYPAAHKFAGSEPSGWQKDLGQIFVHWVGRCLSPRPIPPHTPSFPILIPTPIVSRKDRTGFASFLSRVLDAADHPTNHPHRNPLGTRTFQRA